MQRTAWVTLRHAPHYRADAFANGLEELGFKVHCRFPGDHEVKADDIVVVWNLNPRYRPAAHQCRKAGGYLLVAENGYMPKAGQAYYALARDGHNGSGSWFVGKEDRWSPLGYALGPWRQNDDGYILVADQRGIGSELMRCPYRFYETINPKIRSIFAKVDKRRIPPIHLRAHPGRHKAKRTLKQDLDGARAVVTWASNVANIAVAKGIPAFRVAPYHVNDAVLGDLNLLPDPPERNRLEAFKRLAWAQWSLDDINSGLAFKILLNDVL